MRHWRQFFRTLARAGGVFFFMINSAAADCSYFRSLVDLTELMRQVVNHRIPHVAATAQQVAQGIESVDLVAVRRRLDDLNLSGQFGHVTRLMAISTEYSQTLQLTDPLALARSVQSLQKAFSVACQAQTKNNVVGKVSGTSRQGHQLEWLDRHGSSFKIMLLVLFLSSLIGFMITIKYLAGWALGLLNHKKICRVSAQIRGGGQIFMGVVTRAGLNGVRFEFDSDAVAKSLTDLMAAPEFTYFDLWVGDKNWPVFVDEYQKFFAPVYFLHNISRRELTGILAGSTRAIENAPAIGHSSNRAKWKAQILQRKAKIENTLRQRTGTP